MDRALNLAELGRGQTSPNPMVGAVVVSDTGVVVGTGSHRRAGEAHAEVLALEAAGGAARGGTLYCTLEPCSHHGRTGPCVERVVEAGIRRVVVAVSDPNPRVAGSGVAHLREHGVQVDVGVRQKPAERLNETFLLWVTQGRPFVTMKVAISQDGKISARPGERTPLTSASANHAIHRLRAEVDAIGVGSTTVLVDRRLRTPVTARMVGTLTHGPMIIVTTEGAVAGHTHKATQFREAGVQLEAMRDDDASLGAVLQRLGALEITSLILEGGVAIHRAAWEAGLVDRVQQFVTPITLGAEGVAWLDVSIPALSDRSVRSYGPDVLTEGYVQRID